MLIPAKENIPGRSEFKTRFNKKLGGVSKMFEPIIDQMAEEAESTLMDYWFARPEKPQVKISVSHDFRERHYCPYCKNRNIYIGYNFCPKCGADVVFQKAI
jgi:hypothetical protein